MSPMNEATKKNYQPIEYMDFIVMNIEPNNKILSSFSNDISLVALTQNRIFYHLLGCSTHGTHHIELRKLSESLRVSVVLGSGKKIGRISSYFNELAFGYN